MSSNNNKHVNRYHTSTTYICGTILTLAIIIIRCIQDVTPITEWSVKSWICISLPITSAYIILVIIDIIIFMLEIHNRK
jgi:hypothetical protein